jgi:serine/threonine protein kinase
VVEFTNDTREGFQLVNEPQEVWPFLESGRTQRTFETIKELGSGGCGSVSKVRHKLDNRIYALKKVSLHVMFNPDCE